MQPATRRAVTGTEVKQTQWPITAAHSEQSVGGRYRGARAGQQVGQQRATCHAKQRHRDRSLDPSRRASVRVGRTVLDESQVQLEARS
ncbi:hypothetical protein WDZ92_46780, partial [Nostoc sp. NIES-2111]